MSHRNELERSLLQDAWQQKTLDCLLMPAQKIVKVFHAGKARQGMLECCGQVLSVDVHVQEHELKQDGQFLGDHAAPQTGKGDRGDDSDPCDDLEEFGQS